MGHPVWASPAAAAGYSGQGIALVFTQGMVLSHRERGPGTTVRSQRWTMANWLGPLPPRHSRLKHQN
ncbi:MAG: hypothetical protein WBA99_19845 [Nodosilinea sp.]